MSTFYANHSTCKLFKINLEINLCISGRESKVNIYKKNKCISWKKIAQKLLYSSTRVEVIKKKK